MGALLNKQGLFADLETTLYFSMVFAVVNAMLQLRLQQRSKQRGATVLESIPPVKTDSFQPTAGGLRS